MREYTIEESKYNFVDKDEEPTLSLGNYYPGENIFETISVRDYSGKTNTSNDLEKTSKKLGVSQIEM